MGVLGVADGACAPLKGCMRHHCLHCVTALAEMNRGHYVADIVPTFGLINMMGGELAR